MLRHNGHLHQEAIHCLKHSRQSQSVVESEIEGPRPSVCSKPVSTDGCCVLKVRCAFDHLPSQLCSHKELLL